MRNFSKKILGFVLALCMVIGCMMIPTEAKAATTSKPVINKEASVVGKSSITLVYSGCATYDICLNDKTNKIASRIAETSYTLTNLTPYTSYTIYLYGYDASGKRSDYYSYASVRTLEHDSTVSEVAPIAITPNSISLAINGTGTSYDVYLYGGAFTEYTYAGTYGPQADIANLTPGTKYTFKVYPHDSDGVLNDSYSGYKTIDTNTQVVAPTNVKLDRFWHWAKAIDLSWDKQDAADGYEYILTDSKGKELYHETVTYCSTSFKIKANNIYKFKVRAYKDGVYSDYSEEILCYEQAFAKSFKNTGKKLKLSWNKVKGACGYDVYVSTKQNSGYKKVKTVKANKTSITISKLGKKKISKKKTYYCYIVTKVKHKGQINKSGLVYVWSTKSSGVLYY